MEWARNNCTKDVFKTLKITIIISTIAIFVVIAFLIAFANFKLVYKVTLAGETIGFVSDKALVDKEINQYVNDTTENVIDKQITALPEYNLQFVSRSQNTDEDKVMEAIQNQTITTYKAYTVSFNGEQKAVVSSQDEADNLISEIKQGLNNEIDLNFDVDEVYSNDFNITPEEDAKSALNEVKVAKVAEYNKKKADEEAARIAREKAEQEEAARKAASEKAAKAASVVDSSSWKLEIPKIGLKAVIVDGTTPGILNQYIGHFSETVNENGNIGLAAHNRGFKVNYFANIKDLVNGDIIYYTYNGVTRKYAVVSQEIIDQMDWSKLRQFGDDRLTMITCVSNRPTVRLCVQALRVD